ncbi:hypothetical protein [Spirosoma aerophilum]
MAINTPATNPSRYNWICAVLLALLVALLAIYVVKDFSHPLSDGNDTDHFEFDGYLLNKTISFWPWPHLHLLNNQSFYPYGINQVFMDWGFERDYWYSLCYRLLGGPGSYLQFYYVYSLVVAVAGTFLLLQPRFGFVKAVVAGLIVSVFNFYALYKFPVHLNICIVHWTTLCIITTYCLLFDAINKRPISLAFWLFWAWLHVQVLSQELGYVAGYALTFTTLTFPVLAIVLIRQFPRPNQWVRHLSQFIQAEYNRQPIVIIGLLSLIVISTWLYVPLTLQIATSAWAFDFSMLPELPAWSHPARLLIPYLPGLNTFDVNYRLYLHDTFESFGQGSPGLYLTLFAIVGLWQTRYRITLWLPVVLTALLCLLYHPVEIPTLKIFPWFSYNRDGSRASLIYPVLFVLLAIPISWPRLLAGRAFIIFLLGLMGMEWYNGYHLRLSIPTIVASDNFLTYCSIVKRQPGEAVLDWPFCVIGANGVGASEGLCPYYKAQNAVFSYRRFYDKSTVGQYFGRLHPSQIQPFLRDGWPRLLTPDREFTDQDWRFMDSFLRTNNFAGINLYVDLLLPEQVALFYQRYGKPLTETRFPVAGRVVFIALKK